MEKSLAQKIVSEMRHNSQSLASPNSNVYSSNSSFRSTSPLPPPATTQMCMSGTTKSYKYLRKLLKFDQMDFEFALWQMIYLFVSPQKLYRNFSYRKRKLFIWLTRFFCCWRRQCILILISCNLIVISETKSQFARDDPAFLVLLVLCVLRKWHNKYMCEIA